MKSNYKKLGNYIEAVNRRNIDCKVTDLRGLSLTKEFRSSTSNIVGTDMTTYKIMHKYDFAANFMGLGVLVDKAAIVLKMDQEPNIVSGAYPVFKVQDENKLHPEYLRMWLIRSEFDRFCVFKSDRGIRGGFDWNDLLETQLPIPHIDKQREIVKEYNTIQNRIALNQQLIQKLEETAQAIYREWFVDFEFPDEEGKPYKSGGGEMVWNEELEKEIPKGWEVKPFTKVVKLGGGGTPSTDNNEFWDGDILFYTPGDLSQTCYSINTDKKITNLGLQKCSSKLYRVNTTFITARGATVGGIALAGVPMAMNQTCYAINGNEKDDYFAHQLTISIMTKLKKEAIGATFEALVTKNFDELSVIKPTGKIIKEFEKTVKPLYDLILLKVKQDQKLFELANLLLSKLATIEN